MNWTVYVLVVKSDTSFLKCRHIIVCSFIVLRRSSVSNTMLTSQAKPSLLTDPTPHECTSLVTILLTIAYHCLYRVCVGHSVQQAPSILWPESENLFLNLVMISFALVRTRDLRSFVIRFDFDSYWWSDSKFSNRPRCQSSFVKKRLVVVKFAFKVDFGSKISVQQHCFVWRVLWLNWNKQVLSSEFRSPYITLVRHKYKTPMD